MTEKSEDLTVAYLYGFEKGKDHMKQNRLNSLGNAFIFMVRYALPRKTSADMATVTALRAWWDDIPETHKKIILDEIENEKGLWDNDTWLWDEFLKEMK